MNRNRNLKTLWLIPLVALLVLAALPAQSAQAQLIGGDQQVATMAIHGGSISFAPKIGFEEMTLTVAGRGHVSKQSFRSGETASFVPVDQEGFQLPDGTYKWEIVVSPSPLDLNPAAFKSGKVSADGRMMEMAAAPKGQSQFGVFTIKGGVMVDPNLVEAESPRSLGASSITAPPSAAARAAEHNDQDGN